MKVQIPNSIDCALGELEQSLKYLRLSDIHEHIAMDMRDCKIRIHPFKEYEGLGEGCLLYICTDRSFYSKKFDWFTFLIEHNPNNKHFKKFSLIIKKEIEPLYGEEEVEV